MTLTPRQRLSLLLRLGVFGLAIVLMIAVMHAPRERWLSVVPLELAPSAAAFRDIAVKDWQEPTTTEGGAPRFWRLRGNLFVDSVLFVPGYVSLLLFFTLLLGPMRGLRTRRQLLCVPAVAAGLFDIAENGMTGRALDELIELALVDATVADVSLAARLKWALLGLALAVLAWRAFVTRIDDKPWRALAAALCALAALLFWAGAWRVSSGWINGGMGAVLVALAVLAVRTLRAPPPT